MNNPNAANAIKDKDQYSILKDSQKYYFLIDSNQLLTRTVRPILSDNESNASIYFVHRLHDGADEEKAAEKKRSLELLTNIRKNAAFIEDLSRLGFSDAEDFALLAKHIESDAEHLEALI